MDTVALLAGVAVVEAEAGTPASPFAAS